MTSKVLKIAASLVVVGGALVWLAGASLKDDLEYYKKVDEVMADKARWTGPKLKMGGHVPKGSIFNKPGTLDYIFTVAHNGAEVEVHYTGVVPDTFKDGSEVVVAGRLTPEGYFEANEVIAKCPSKYESRGKGKMVDPEAPTAEANAYGRPGS
ncbi:MAG: cytochrome c maturation protein CcmE [Deltaproteobacteria bacterium]|nr:MAG: cytochrome c maturation protein CcmE [Deltaproteobacteria bacterium]